MAQIINFDFEKARTEKDESYKSKLIRISKVRLISHAIGRVSKH